MLYGKFLAIDYGEKRIGFAISDEMNLIALPLIQFENKGTKNLLIEFKKYIQDDKIQGIVWGLPLSLSGEERPLTEKIRRIASELKEVLKLPIYFVDERFSSREVSRDLIKRADKSRAKRKKVLDKLAASKILQTFLERRDYEKS